MAVIIGVTGGIGSGKSLFCSKLEAAGFPVFYCDTESKNILRDDLVVKMELTELLGTECYNIDNTVNTQFIAKKIFNNEELRNKMNAIVHPAVKNHCLNWAKEQKDVPFVFVESAILFESGFNDITYATILVTAPEELRIERVKKRDNCSTLSVKERMAAQWSDDKKIKLATHIVENGQNDDLNEQVFSLLKRFYNDPAIIGNEE